MCRTPRTGALALWMLVASVACGGSSTASPDADAETGTGAEDATADEDSPADAEPDAAADVEPDAAVDAEPDAADGDEDVAPDAEADADDVDVGPDSDIVLPDGDGGGPDVPPGRFLAVTFNTGTTEGTTHDEPGDLYDAEKSGFSDLYYGDGLAWLPAVAAVQAWLAELRPDIIAFQEMFYSGRCPDVPAEARAGFVCETWAPGDPTVVQLLLGPDYQVACHLGKDDKCLAVRKAFGRIRQCADPDFCLEGLDGARVDGCGSGSRVGRATIDLVGGGELTVVSCHGTSGVLPEDADCRAAQVRQVFEDLDGAPAANGARNLVLGDLNVDPCCVPTFLDLSSDEWNRYVGSGEDFDWISPCGPLVPPTYAGVLNIDHLAADAFTGDCRTPGVTAGFPAVYPPAYFDHKPLVCEVGDR